MPALRRFAPFRVRAGILGLLIALAPDDVRTQTKAQTVRPPVTPGTVGGARTQTVRPPVVPDAAAGAPVYGVLWTVRRVWTDADLLKLAAAANPYERQYAVLQLGEHGETSDAAVNAVAAALGDRAEVVRLQAMGSLLRLRGRAHQVLIDALRNGRTVGPFQYFSEERNSTEQRQISPADLAFTVLSRQKDVSTSALVAAYLKVAGAPVGKLPRGAFTAGRLGVVKGNEVVERTPAQRILLLISQSPAQSPVALLPLLERVDAESRLAALLALQNAVEVPAALGPPLAQVLTSAESDLARLAANVLSRVAPATLEEAARAASPTVRAAAISGLAFGRPLFFDRLSGALKDSAQEVRLAAIDRAADARISLEDVTCLGLRSDPKNARFSSLRQLSAAMPAALFGEMLADRDRMTAAGRERWSKALARIACLRPDLDAPLTAALMSDLGGTDAGRQTFALEALGGLADDGHIVQIDDWVPQGLALLAAKNLESERRDALARLLAAGTIRPDTAGTLVAGYQRLVEQAPDSAEEFLSNLEDRPSSIVRIRTPFMALLARRDLQTFEEAEIAVLAADPGGVLPEPLRKALTTWTGPRSLQLLRLVEKRASVDDLVLTAIERAMRSGAPDPYALRQMGKALVEAGPRGVARLVAIAKDPGLQPALRGSAAESLGEFASTEAATPAVLGELINDRDPVIRVGALQGFSSPEYRGAVPAALAETLRRAVRDGSREVRAAAVSAWVARGLPVRGEIDLLARDPDGDVRAGAMEMVGLLPRDDPRRAALLRAGLRDRDSHVRHNALEAASAGGTAGATVLAELLTPGSEIGWNILKAIEGLSGDAAPLAPKAIEMLSRTGTDSGQGFSARPTLLKVLGAVAARVPDARRVLLEVATNGSESERKLAAEALVNNGVDPWQVEPVLTAVLLDTSVRARMSVLLAEVLDVLYPYWGMIPVSGQLPNLPTFPWPPPAGHKWVTVPRTLPGVNVKTLGDLYDSLLSALGRANAGFESGLFGGVPNGFAVVARMERIQTNGAPYPGDSRWVTQGTPFLSLGDFLGNLFFEKPGYFRVIALVVTDDVNFSADPTAKLPSIGEGAREMPPDMRAKRFETQSLLALIYTFERKPGAEITTWPNGAPSGTQHLTAAGILGALQSR